MIMTATGPRDPRARALAEAMGGAMSPQAMEREDNGSASSVVLDASQRVKDDAAKAEAEAKAVRDAARRDIEERKEHRRRIADKSAGGRGRKAKGGGEGEAGSAGGRKGAQGDDGGGAEEGGGCGSCSVASKAAIGGACCRFSRCGCWRQSRCGGSRIPGRVG